MPAGREMDALIAKKVMDWDGVGLIKLSWGMTSFEDFQPSARIADAWEVMEKLDDLIIMKFFPGPWACGTQDDFDTEEACEGPAPLAICRAALKVVSK